MKFQPKNLLLEKFKPHSSHAERKSCLLYSSSIFPCGYDARLAFKNQLLLFRVLKGKNLLSAHSRTRQCTNCGAFKPQKPKQLTRIFTRLSKWQQRDSSQTKPAPSGSASAKEELPTTVVTNTHGSNQDFQSHLDFSESHPLIKEEIKNPN